MVQHVYLLPFLNAITYAIINSLWQVAFLYIIYVIVTNLFTIHTKARFTILVLLQCISLGWFITTLISALKNGITSNYFSIINISFTQNIAKAFPIIAVIYLFFVIVFIVKLLLQYFATNNSSNSYQQSITSVWNNFVAQAASNLHISKNIVLKVSTNNIIPFTIGYIKPIIVVPLAAINNLSAKEFEAILLHELAHIKRNDYIINIALLIVESVLCFNPITTIINKNIEIERELCCDDIVVNYPFVKTIYATALLNVARMQATQNTYTTAFSLGAFTTNTQLKNRIERLLNITTTTKKHTTKAQLLLLSLFAFLLFGIVGFINYNVKNIITTTKYSAVAAIENTKKVAFINTAITKQALTKKNVAKYCKAAHKQNTKSVIVTVNNNSICTTLEQDKKIIEKGFINLAQAITANKETIFSNASITSIMDTLQQTTVNITPAIATQPQVSVQKFLIPATPKNAASIIIVTTTTKDDGNKQVKIEIENGNSRVE